MAKRSSRAKMKARSKGGGRGRDKDRDKDKRKSRTVRAQGGSNHVPFMIAGGALLVLIIVGLMVKVTHDQRAVEDKRRSQNQSAHPRQQDQAVHDRQVSHASSSGAAPSVPMSTGAAMATRRSAWASARIQVARDRKASGDQRYLKAYCGNCNAQLSQKVASCPKCQTKLRWQEKVNCNFCSDAPTVELGDGQSKVGFCGQCNGSGKNPNFKPAARLPFGMSTDGTGLYGEKCPACKGSGGCIHCRGRGRFEMPEYFGG